MRHEGPVNRRGFILGTFGLSMVAARFAFPQGAGGQPPSERETVDDLVAANLILAAEGVLDAMGHVSVRHPTRADRYFLARSMAPALVTAADIIEYDLDSTAMTPSARNGYLERFIHGETYRARPDVRAVVHCHTPSLIPFASSTVPLRAMYHMAAFVAAGVPVWDIATAGGVTDLLVRDGKLARSLAGALGDRAVVLMRGHGAVVVANSLPNVVGRAVYLDVNAKAQTQAFALGGTIRGVTAEEAKLRMGDPNEYARAWELWRRKVGK
jgi:HCOMODA/2-hydroxy-3-carboxy-muconic semialdehyde decarboxylase